MDKPTAKRRLPVIGTAPESETLPASPAWWPFLGGIIIVSTWVPQVFAILFLIRRWASNQAGNDALGPRLLGALLLAFTFALSNLLGGALVGRFLERARSANSMMAGLWAWSFVMVLSILGDGFRPWLVGVIVGGCMLAVALPCSRWGGRLGRR